MQRVVARNGQPDQRMPGFVVGREALLLIGHDHRAPLDAHQHLVLGRLEVEHRHQAFARARRQQCGLVDEIGEIGAGKPRRAAGDHPGVDIRCDLDLAHVHLQDHLAADDVGVGDDHLTIEAAGAQQRRIEDVGPVGRGNEDDALVGLEPVHLDQELVQGLLAFVVAAAETGAAMATDRVDFIDEDNARGVLLALLEHVADSRRADTDEHLDEVGARDGKERDVGLAGDRASEQRLAGSGRADQQAPLRDLAAQTLKPLRILEEVDDLFKLLLGLLDAGDIAEGDPSGLLGQKARPRLAEAHRLAAARLHLTHEEDPDADQQQHREPGDENAPQRWGSLIDGNGIDADAVLLKLADHIGVGWREGGQRPAVAVLPGNLLALDGDIADVTVLHLGDELRVGQLLARLLRRRALKEIEQRKDEQRYDDPQCEVSTHVQVANPCRFRV